MKRGEIAGFEKRLAELDSEKQRPVQLAIKAMLSEDDFATEQARVDNEIKTARRVFARLNQAKRNVEARAMDGERADYAALVREFGTRLENLSFTDRQYLVRAGRV